MVNYFNVIDKVIIMVYCLQYLPCLHNLETTATSLCLSNDINFYLSAVDTMIETSELKDFSPKLY